MAPRRPETRTARRRTWLHSGPVLLLAFAFAVMADPVSSVAYAIEAALRALHGDLALLLPTMGLVLAIVALVVVNYHQLVAKFPNGGGAPAAAGSAFGEGWSFLPLGALIVDFALTIAISVAAGASAIIAYVPRLATLRVPLALTLLVAVAALTWFGHGGRSVFAAMTIAFVIVGTIVLVFGFVSPVGHGVAIRASSTSPHSPPLAVLLAFPVAMALATGVEAPSSAIAQLGQLDDDARRRFGRVTLWLTLAVVAWLTVGVALLAVRLHIGIPPARSTQVAEVARASVGGGGLFAAFQLTSALLLLAAASSSFQAGPGLLKALAGAAILPSRLGLTNEHHTPYWGVVAFLVVSGAVVVAAGGRDQELVLFYAVAVFVSFLAGLLAMARFSREDRRPVLLAVNALGAVAVAVTLVINLGRGYPIASLIASAAAAATLHRLWVRAGRPRGVSTIESLVDDDDDMIEANGT